MQVRCKKCDTAHELEDASITDIGVTVKCATCGNMFRVRRRVSQALASQATDLSPASPGFLPAEGTSEKLWWVRDLDGKTHRFKDLQALQKWIGEIGATPEFEISRTGEAWKKMSDVVELAPLFQPRAQKGAATLRFAGPGVVSTVPEMVFPSKGEEKDELSGPVGNFPGGTESRDPDWASGRRDARNFRTHVDAVSSLQAAGMEARNESASRTVPDLPAVKVSFRGTLWLVGAVLLGGSALVYFQWVRGPAVRAGAILDAPQTHPTAALRPGERDAAVPGAASEPAPMPPAPQVTPRAASLPDAAPIRAVTPLPPGSGGTSSLEPSFDLDKNDVGYTDLVAKGDRLAENGRCRDAKKLYERALDLRPGGAEALTGVGYCDLDAGHYANAQSMFRAALGVSPRFGDALIGIAEAYQFQGQKDKSVEYFRRYLDLYPQGSKASIARRHVGDTGSSPKESPLQLDPFADPAPPRGGNRTGEDPQ